MSLMDYNRKRNFAKTPEPKGKINTKPKTKAKYVVQKHEASHLHYDFRLELNGTLKSWAVPKGPSLNPTIKRLAVHVEDHPLEYANFEGVIPKGEYGGGTVMLWDNGYWECLNQDPISAYKKGHLHFIIHGTKLQGEWQLIQLKNDLKNWLLVKSKDQYSSARNDITKKSKSVTSARTLLQIARQVKLFPKKTVAKQTLKKILTLPKNLKPQLAMLAKSMPQGSDWLYEIKFDGYRLLCYKTQGQVTLFTRNQQDWTAKFPHLVKELSRLPVDDCILDGEVVALTNAGKSSFQALQQAIKLDNTQELHYFMFDLLFANGKDFRDKPLWQRKQKLASFFKKNIPKHLHYSEHFVAEGEQAFENACSMGLEGLIAKKINSFYYSKRTSDWLKIKCVQQAEFFVIGYTEPQSQHLGALLLGYYNEQYQLVYCGKVGTGFNQQQLKEIKLTLKSLTVNNLKVIHKPKLKSVRWVTPKYLAKINYTEWTNDGHLRHPSFQGWRINPQEFNIINNFTALSHPDKILYPQAQIKKLDLAEYYACISELLLTYSANKPLSLVRCPQGVDKTCFFQKHLSQAKNTLPTVDIKDKSGRADYCYIENAEHLLYLVQLGVVEIHSWNCNVKDTAHPDMMVFDIDPAPEVSYRKVVDTAFLIRDRLAELKLKSFVKTTGGKGLHVVVPVTPKYSWEDIKNFSHAFVEILVELHPKLYVSKASKELRKGKIFIDYLRNQHGATSIIPYSTRRSETATLAIPLSWEELSVKLKSNYFTLHNIQQRLHKLDHDPWEGFLEIKQSIITRF